MYYIHVLHTAPYSCQPDRLATLRFSASSVVWDRQHCRLSICDYRLSWTNTVSEAKIQITLLILNGNPVEDCCVIDPEFQVLSMILWLGHNVVQSIDFISARGGIFGKPQKNQQPWYSWPSKIFASLFLIYKDLKWILFRSWAKDGNVHVLCHPILICVTRRWCDTEKWKRLLIRVKPT